MREMRRQDRKLSDSEALEILCQGEYGILATVTTEGFPYGVPISFAVDEENRVIYFHGTNQDGQKTDNLAHQPNACLTVVTRTELIPEKFATKYWSVNVFGTVATVIEEADKQHGLELILRKYAPDHIDKGKKYIDGAMDRVRVMKMDIEFITGKARKS